MLYSSRGIVFQQIKFSESSIIAKIFTEKHGLQSFMVKGVRSKRSSTKAALFQALTLVDIVAFHKENSSLNHLKEIRVAFAYQGIPMDMEKRSVLIFLNELLFRSIREETPNQELFNWLFNALKVLDLSNESTVNFHLVFMLHLSRFLGFHPKKELGKHHLVFDLEEGQFCNNTPKHPQYISGNLVTKLEMLYDASFESGQMLDIRNEERRKLADILVNFYSLHLPGFGEMKSLDILKTVLS